MALPGNKNFSDYDKYVTDLNPTTSAQAQDYFRNQAELLKAVIDCDFWQPETVYQPGDVVKSDSMPNGTEAVMVATKASVTSNVEPQWGAVGGANISDGACFWKLRWQHWSKDVDQITDLTTRATNRLPNTNYAVGNVVYDRSNLSVALKCTQTGTTSNTELDISGLSVGESVEDGNVAWEVVSRDTVATIDKQRPIKTFTSLEELGLDNKCTPEDIALALPNNSILSVDVKNTNFPNLEMGVDGLLTVKKPKGDGYVEFVINSIVGRYVANYSAWANKKFTGWKKVATDGALSMPSNNYLTLNLAFTTNSSNSLFASYTAPADGWLSIQNRGFPGGTSPHFFLVNADNYIWNGVEGKSVNSYLALTTPVTKGATVSITTLKGVQNSTNFYFVYAQSEV